MKQVLEKINSIYKKSLAAKFQISLGDEFQGLVQDLKYRLINSFSKAEKK
ncbi:MULTISPECIES: SatD family protein [Bacillota]|nr:hypothetical protein DW271_08825 [Absiella sp. AM22-9]RGB62659.1 hypothetical protein DW120_02000 [Absiella sp. AM10-20]RGB69525.1 hypothetical protein DW113_02345 [Absiella sp. AM09-45]RGB77707.1 hypothetical protein DW114_05205 [Absiella sp. AM09-50]RGC22201.1 hypothetical protein DXA09_09870 [Absiella sp. AM54-8XD]RGC50202.1 hypothetical protein DW761_13010 [Absiella sp. AM29-15]RHU10086.1 hypothetical protein DW716_02515 [Absiella sp. AM27-20]